MNKHSEAHSGQCDDVAAVVVTFNPDEGSLTQLISALRPQVGALAIVDNGSANATSVAALASEHDALLIAHAGNVGVARAQNEGIRWALEQGFRYVLLSDQDSVPSPRMVHKQREVFEGKAESETGAPIAAVGPVPLDERGESEHALVYSFTRWGARRTVVPQAGEVLEVPFVLASGCLISAAALRDVGPMNESLFIDHVDLAWCLRALQKGYRVVVDGSAHLAHSLGEDKVVLPWGREVHVQSPTRNYFMVRNTLLLQRAPFLSLTWKLGYLSYLAKYVGFYALVGLKEPKRWTQLGRGLRDGILGRGGPGAV